MVPHIPRNHLYEKIRFLAVVLPDIQTQTNSGRDNRHIFRLKFAYLRSTIIAGQGQSP